MSLAALAGCGDSTTEQEPPPPGSTITGTRQVFHWDELGQQTPADVGARNLYIEAELPGGDVRPATVADDGSFSIGGSAPTGMYWLRLVDGPFSREDVYVLTDQTQLDLGRDVVGNEAKVAEDQGTHVVITATGLANWADGDDGDFVLANLAHISTIVPYYAKYTPVAGDTAMNTSYAWYGQPVSSTSTGDDAYIVQTRAVHDDALALDYYTPVKSFHSAPVAINDGATSTITGTFTDPPALDVPVHWMRSAFAAQADAMHPAGCDNQLELESYWVHALPGAGTHGEKDGILYDGIDGAVEYGPRVVHSLFSLAQTDLIGTIKVRNPYPADWLYAKYSMTWAVNCTTPFGNPPGNASVSIGLLTSKLDDSPVTPLVGPVGHASIGGRDLLVPQNGVGLAPTISWQAPAIGTATSYEVKVFEVAQVDFGGGVSLQENARLIVPGSITSITLPRDVLQPDTVYTIEIRAVSQPGQDATRAPFRSGMPLGYADLLTNYFTP